MLAALIVTVLLAAAALMAVSGAALVLGWELLGCYWDRVPMSATPICGSTLWGAAWVPGALLAACVLWLVVALASALAVGVRQFGSAATTRRRLERLSVEAPSALAFASAEVGADDVVCVAGGAPLAVTIGLARARIFVSEGLVGLLDHEELAAVLRHERQHAARRHPLAFGVARTCAALTPALPAVAAFARRVVLQAEVAADRAAVEGGDVRALAGALSKLVPQTSARPDGAAVGSIGGQIDERIRALAGLSVRQPSLRDFLPTTMVVAGVMTAVSGSVVAALGRAHGWI